MERYFPVVSRTSNRPKENGKKRADVKYKPYPSRDEAGHKGEEDKFSQFRLQLQQSDAKASSSSLTKFILATLKDESNPITHSDIKERSDNVVSISTGHQVGDRQLDRKSYLKDREGKLTVQRSLKGKSIEGQVLDGVRVYIDGYLENTTDIEMRRIISRAGGVTLMIPSGCTHIVTSMQLSGSKTHKLLTTKSRTHVHVVKPEWVFDSIKAGKKKPEREYVILKNSTMKTLHDMAQKNSGALSN